MESMLREKFYFYKEKFELNSKLCFDMPSSRKTANGLYDDSADVVYVNSNIFKDGEVFCLYNLLHEIRHAYQHKKGEWFVYYFEYDGKAYRFDKENNNYFECYVQGS